MCNLGHMRLALRLVRLILDGAIGACSLISHSLTLCCIHVAHPLRMQLPLLLQYLVQIYVLIYHVLTKTAGRRVWTVSFLI